MKLRAITLHDFYKSGHIFQYPKKTQVVYSNYTPRSDRLAKVLPDFWDKKIVNFGIQGLIKAFLIDLFNETFFLVDKATAVGYYQRRVDTSLGKGAVPVQHIADLWDLGYLPIEIKALPEGAEVNIGVPVATFKNTIPEFFWVTNFLETLISAEYWKKITTATIARQYRKLINHWAEVTGSAPEFCPWQGHDFSLRGVGGMYDGASNNSGHLLSFYGTDTIPAIDYLEDYYGADADNELIGGSVPATEHSVMCMGGNETEIDTFRRLITEVYPSGIVSIVSDTWDFWKVITQYAAELKDEILARTPDALGMAKVVFRPDSGDPVDIICGDPEAPEGSPAYKGAVQCLYEIFGGDKTSKGYITLNQRVGLIYGDSITLERAQAIFQRLAAKGFSSGNIVFGIGSYTYQYVTRDTFGQAIKATYGIVDGEERELFKDPITDNGTKKSAKGLLRVVKEGNDYVLYDQQTADQEAGGELEVIFRDGKMIRETTLAEIRQRLAA